MKNSNDRILKAASIGIIASEIFSKDQEARVFSNTSKGLFLQTPDRWLVFLSFEPFKGPLTITLEGVDPLLQLLSSGDALQITSSSLYFSKINLRISVDKSQVWQPPPPSAPLLDESERHDKLVWVAKEILSVKEELGLAALILPLLGLPNARSPLQFINDLDRENIQQLKNDLRNEQAVSLADRFSAILGTGPGLTPSADDFIAGLLLTLNRWHIPLWTTDRLHDLNTRVVKAAYDKTTTLSANLIYCATRGLANERLINALDWIVIGAANEPYIVANLLGWGHSSGVDAFAGMAVALKA